MSAHTHIDRFYLVSVIFLTVFGFVIFLSASLGLLAQNGASFEYVALKQGISLLLGIGCFYVFSRIKYLNWKKLAFFILLGAIAVNLLLFIPGISLYYGGASRWIELGPLTFQPSEFLKIAFIIYLAAWIQFAKEKIESPKYGLFPYMIIMAVLTVLLMAQSDTDTLAIIAVTGMVMMLIAGMPIKHFLASLFVLIAVVASVIYFRPYAAQRFQTFLDRGSDTQGAGYQINQSLIAIGSGEIFGRGFGQSVQKFGYLPQPTDDSIFAVAGEEFGFLGTTWIVIMYVLLAVSTFRVGTKSPDVFAGMVAIGFGLLVISESFLNMAAMLGLVPLSGLPLLFVSHGGTALIITLLAGGIVANISRYSHTS